MKIFTFLYFFSQKKTSSNIDTGGGYSGILVLTLFKGENICVKT